MHLRNSSRVAKIYDDWLYLCPDSVHMSVHVVYNKSCAYVQLANLVTAPGFKAFKTTKMLRMAVFTP